MQKKLLDLKYNKITKNIIIQKLAFGFKLSNRPINKKSDFITINKSKIYFNNSTYIKIKTPQKTIYIATQHHAAYYFMLKEFFCNNIYGTEHFYHIDQSGHPDNLHIDRNLQPKLTDKLSKHKTFYAKENSPTTMHLLHEGSYISALKNIFNNMHFEFIHEGIVQPDDYPRTCFKPNKTIYAYEKLKIKENNIFSLDLDIFEICQKKTKVLQILNKLARKAKLVMIFTSPGYIKDPTIINTYIQKIINSLF